MKNLTKRTLLLMLAMTWTAAGWCMNSLDGTHWHLRLMPQDASIKEAKPFETDLMFAGSEMTVSMKGFKPAAYNVVTDQGHPGQKIWIAGTAAEDKSKADWRGQVLSDGTMEGLLTRTNAAGKEVRYTFRGEQKQ